MKKLIIIPLVLLSLIGYCQKDHPYLYSLIGLSTIHISWMDDQDTSKNIVILKDEKFIPLDTVELFNICPSCEYGERFNYTLIWDRITQTYILWDLTQKRFVWQIRKELSLKEVIK